MSASPAGAGRLARLVAAFSGRRVLVLGDLMVDRYYAGSVRRISPEAPVPVVEVTEEHQRFGGAANVALNVRRLGARVELCGLVGADAEGDWLLAALEREGIEGAGVVRAPGIPTILKCRVVAHNQQVVRFDRERAGPPAAAVMARVERHLSRAWPAVDAVVVSDYGKGLVQDRLMRCVRALNRGPRAKPVAVDPKSIRFELYRGATVITPNLAEALAAARFRGASRPALEQLGPHLLRRAGSRAILVTRGEQGMTLFERGAAPVHIPTEAREVYDVTGAGDTVISVVTLALAAGAPLREAAVLANLAAGVVVGEFGTVAVTREQLLSAIERRRAGV